MSKQVSLFIEDNEVKLLLTNGKEVEKWASLMLDSGLVVDGVIQKEDIVAQSLREFMAGQELGGATVVASLMGLNSIFRIISLPAGIPKNILEEAVQNEANRVIPVPLDQVYLSRQLLSTTGLEHRYFLVAYPKNAADALARTVQKAGLKIKVMDVAPLALARLANVNRAIMVNAWLSNVDIIILVDRVPEVIRSFSLPSETMTEAELTMSIAEEISRTVTFYNSSHPENPLSAEVPILVSGRLTNDKAWPALGGSEGHPVEAITTPFEAPNGFDASQFIINLGLVPLPKEEAAFGSVININVLPDEYLPKGINWFNILAPIAGVILIGGLVYGWFLIDDFKQQNDEIQLKIDAVQTQVTLTQADIARIQAETAGVDSQTAGIDKAITPIVTKTDSLETQYQYMRNQREKASGDVRNAWLRIPSNKVTLDTIEWGEGVLTIKGVATEGEVNVFAYAAALRDTHRFENVIVAEIIKELIEDTKVYIYNFTLIMY